MKSSELKRVCESLSVVTLWAGAVRQAKLSQQIWPCHPASRWMVGLFV